MFRFIPNVCIKGQIESDADHWIGSPCEPTELCSFAIDLCRCAFWPMKSGQYKLELHLPFVQLYLVT